MWMVKKRHDDKQLDEYVKMQHNQASKELSYSSEMSDLAFANGIDKCIDMIKIQVI